MGAPLMNALTPAEMPSMLFRLRVQLLAATHVVTPNDPFLESHLVDPSGCSFLWWKDPAQTSAIAGGLAASKPCDAAAAARRRRKQRRLLRMRARASRSRRLPARRTARRLTTTKMTSTRSPTGVGLAETESVRGVFAMFVKPCGAG